MPPLRKKFINHSSVYTLFFLIFSLRIFSQTSFFLKLLRSALFFPIPFSVVIWFILNTVICHSLHFIFPPTFWFIFFKSPYTNLTVRDIQSYGFDKWIEFTTTVPYRTVPSLQNIHCIYLYKQLLPSTADN